MKNIVNTAIAGAVIAMIGIVLLVFGAGETPSIAVLCLGVGIMQGAAWGG